jgi:hypothetical protein
LDDEAHGDEQIAEALRGEDPDVDEVLSTILNTTICRALAFFDFALETGEVEPIESARACSPPQSAWQTTLRMFLCGGFRTSAAI